MVGELVQVIPGRPVVIKKDNWTIFLSIRDQDYLRSKRQWKRKLAEVHPDRNGGKGKVLFVRTYTRYQRFLNEARRYYWRLDHLMPPDWRGPSRPPTGMISPKEHISFTDAQSRFLLQENN